MSNVDSPLSKLIELPENVLGGNDAVAFSQQIREAAESGVRQVRINLSFVKVINSSGLGMLVAALSTMRKFGGSVIFCRTPEKVMSLLRMTHLDTVFEFTDALDEDETIAA